MSHPCRQVVQCRHVLLLGYPRFLQVVIVGLVHRDDVSELDDPLLEALQLVPAPGSMRSKKVSTRFATMVSD